jgi:hypothetical protein
MGQDQKPLEKVRKPDDEGLKKSYKHPPQQVIPLKTPPPHPPKPPVPKKSGN